MRFVFGLEAALGAVARLAGRLDALEVGVDLARGVAHGGGDLQLEIAQADGALLALQAARGDGRIRLAGADRVAEVQRHAPGAEVLAEDVAQRVGERARATGSTMGGGKPSPNTNCVPATPMTL